jgi:hypothetical protein
MYRTPPRRGYNDRERDTKRRYSRSRSRSGSQGRYDGRSRQLREGLCFNCGEKGHIRINCPGPGGGPRDRNDRGGKDPRERGERFSDRRGYHHRSREEGGRRQYYSRSPSPSYDRADRRPEGARYGKRFYEERPSRSRSGSMGGRARAEGGGFRGKQRTYSPETPRSRSPAANRRAERGADNFE